MPATRQELPAARVRALFETEALSFPLPRGATFADLADRIEFVAELARSRPVAIAVTVAPAAARN
jgi:hypothetical protein